MLCELVKTIMFDIDDSIVVIIDMFRRGVYARTKNVFTTVWGDKEESQMAGSNQWPCPNTEAWAKSS
jgi:hypothetical protein